MSPLPFLSAFAAILLCGCYSHTQPAEDSFVQEEGSRVPAIRLFADANGTFYPSGWKSFKSLKTMSRGKGSVINASFKECDPTELARHVKSEEKRQLQAVADFGKKKDRIFIFIHGFNNTSAEAKESYDEIENMISFAPSDGVVRFYWDGLNAKFIWGGKIWFNAVGYSQMAGSRGLRRVLNQFQGREIVIVCHSRGASVVLSALSNPVYNSGFLDDTKKVVSSWRGDYSSDKAVREFVHPRPLMENRNRIKVIAMAPAVGKIDFFDQSHQKDFDDHGAVANANLKDLGKQLEKFRYSVNKKDRVLRKYINQGHRFNPTGLGHDLAVGDEIERRYPNTFEHYCLDQPMTEHGWEAYLKQREIRRMFSESGVKLKSLPVVEATASP